MNDHEQLYSSLRADILARHFSLNRYTRADLFNMESFLGTLIPARDDDGGASPGGISWEIPTSPQLINGIPMPGPGVPLYSDAIDLRSKLRDGSLPQTERWRWVKHDRTNSLLMTGIRIISLCVDARLGDPLAMRVLARVLRTLEALFRFRQGPAPFAGYIVRWDVVASDLWETEPKLGERPRGFRHGAPRLVQNHEFLLNGDPKTFAAGEQYLYCTPFSDRRYQLAVERFNGDQRGADRYRRWEPSPDEYVGLVAGYFMIWHTFREANNPFRDNMDSTTRAAADNLLNTARDHVRRIGNYLKATGYYLVRPCGGFAARGALDRTNVILEYPFARAFSRITGDPIASFLPDTSATFEAAIQMAGYGEEYSQLHISRSHFKGSLEQILRANGAWPQNVALQESVRVLISLGVTLTPGHVIKAGLFHERLNERFEINEDNPAATGAANYIFNCAARVPLIGSKGVFEKLFPIALRGSDASSKFAPLMGLTALDDDADLTVAGAYVEWHSIIFANASENPDREIEPGDVNPGTSVFSAAVDFLLLPDTDKAGALEADLEKMRNAIVAQHDGKPPIGAYGMPGAPDLSVGEQHDSAQLYFGYSLPLSICWLHLARGVSPGFNAIEMPAADSIRMWPDPSVPTNVIHAGFQFPSQWLIRSPLPPGAGEIPLFKDPPDRPQDSDLGNPPPPVPVAGGEFDVPATGAWTDGWPNPTEYTLKREMRVALPDLPPELDPKSYVAQPTLTHLERSHVEWAESFIDGNDCVVQIRFDRRLGHLLPDLLDDRRYRGHVVVAWVRHTD